MWGGCGGDTGTLQTNHGPFEKYHSYVKIAYLFIRWFLDFQKVFLSNIRKFICDCYIWFEQMVCANLWDYDAFASALHQGIGNGIPLGAVVTTPDIAKVLTNRTYFNTFGGNPVCTAGGLAVLKVLEKEKLQQNALTVGSYLKERLVSLMEKHESTFPSFSFIYILYKSRTLCIRKSLCLLQIQMLPWI